MAKKVKKTQQQKRIKEVKAKWYLPFNRSNFILFAIGLGVIIVGFLLMATGITEEPALLDGKWNNFFAITLAPILLVIGYCIIIPLAILKYPREKSEES